MNTSKLLKRCAIYLAIIFVLIILFYLLSIAFILLGIYRLNAMVFSAFISPVIAWQIFPIIFWRPLSLRVTFISMACVFFGYLVSAILVVTKIGLPGYLSGPYDLYNFIIYSTCPAIFFEWVNRFHHHWIFPDKDRKR